MKILFAFENPLPSTEADAEVFITTAKCIAPLTAQSWLHVPMARGTDARAVGTLASMAAVHAWAPVRPAALRHICCGLGIVWRREFRQADLVYTRNLWVAWMALLFGQRVVFDHYRPWPDQIPPLQFWLYRLICHPRFLLNICHSEYTRVKYLSLGIPAHKLQCVHNGFEPRRLQPALSLVGAKEQIGIAPGQTTIVYTGRINHKKGLNLVIEAAQRMPEILFVLVGSYGHGPIEQSAKAIPNIRIVPWQSPDGLRRYIFAADALLIPPSLQPLTEFGSTVLPLKIFLYMASGRPIIAGDTPDVREVLKHNHNALLCQPDNVESLVAAIASVTEGTALAQRLAETAQTESRDLTWDARAQKIAALITSRLQPPVPVRHGAWNIGQFRNWARQSLRWLVHLVRNHSWVLPPVIEMTAQHTAPTHRE